MIVLLVHEAHAYTHELLVGAGRYDLRILSYRRALRSPRLRTATYVFTDMDRLDSWTLELAGRLYRRLRDSGARVLNDPARARQRPGLLRALKDRGINDFDVWRVEDGRWPERFPVFLRRQAGHQGPLSDLLPDLEETRRAVESWVARGVPARELILVEYRGEPVREGLFRKLGMFRVGDRLVPALSAHQRSWAAKRGELGIAGQELYDEELEIVTGDRYARDLRPAFDAVEIEYGRADFGVVGGRVQVYEINTNPHVKRLPSHPFPVREETGRIVFRRLVEALEAIDTPAGPRVRIEDRYLDRQRRHDRWVLRSSWLP